jgi:protein-S-isoprenylcysteine O-methyltransferase Ste14
MSELDSDTPGIAVPPPVLFIIPLALGLALGRGTRTDSRGAAFARTVGVASIAAGAGLGIAALAAIRRAGSSPNPYAPTTALVTDGAFSFTRNPAYVGATAISVGIGLAARSLPALAFLPITLALLDRFVVDREERYLERRFGHVYREYKLRVPRWF